MVQWFCLISWRLFGVCTGWSGPLLFAYGIRHIFAWSGPYDVTKAIDRQWKIETVWANAWQNQQNDVLPAKTDQPVPSSLIGVLAVRMKKPWILSYLCSASEHSNVAGWMFGCSESSLCAQVFMPPTSNKLMGHIGFGLSPPFDQNRAC